MATIVATKAKTWKAVVRRTGYPTTSKTFRLKKAAEDWARAIEDEMARRTYIDRSASEKTTLRQAMERYLTEVSPTKSQSTQTSEKTKSQPLVRILGDYSLATLTPDIIASYRDKRLCEDVQTKSPKSVPKGRVSSSTVLHELALLSHLFTTAIQEWHIGLTINPVSGVRKPRPGRGRNRRLELQEEGRLLEATRAYSNPFLGWIVELALETSMRLGEVSSITLEQLDLTKRIVMLPDTKNGDIRLVPLSRRATEILHEALNFPRPADCKLIFFGEPGLDGVRRPYKFNRAWRDIKTRLGMADFRFHDLRHEAVSRLISAGIPDQQVAAISGHKSMQMLKRYAHLRSETLVAVLDRVQS
ncbi:site-specific integrase [Pseudomonas sp. CrR25]|nr:site-specific integrase [Pseudomonas sp. CrR25]